MNSLRRYEKHGMTHTRTYRIWKHMIRRCENPKDDGFALYGGRGITVCARWRKSFAAFVTDMGICPARMSIDRKDVNGNYEKTNCRWASAVEQGNNKRNNVFLTVDGVTKTLAEWARETGFERAVLGDRLKRGWSHEQVVKTPRYGIKNPGKPVEFEGQSQTLSEWARQLGIPWDCLYRRIHYYGWSVEKAFRTPSRPYRAKREPILVESSVLAFP